MKVTCSTCGADYQVDDRKIPATGAFVTCKKCKTKIKLAPPAKAMPAKADRPKTGVDPAAPAVALPSTNAPADKAKAGAPDDAIPLPTTIRAPEVEVPPAPPLPPASPENAPAPRAAPTPSGEAALVEAGRSAPALAPDPVGVAATTSPVDDAAVGAAVPAPGAADVGIRIKPDSTKPPAVISLGAGPAAPAPTDGAIALGGATADPTDGAIALGVATAAPTDGAIALGGATADPTDGAIALGGATAADTAAPDLDALFDLPAAVAADVPAPMDGESADASVSSPAAPPSPPPDFLDDLPVAADAPADPFAGIPPAPDDANTDAGLDDLPAPFEAPSLMDDAPLLDDLPVAAGSIDLEQDLPIGIDQAPSFMDDLPVADGADAALDLDAIPSLDIAAPALAGPDAADPFAAVATDVAGDAMVDLRRIDGDVSPAAADAALPEEAKPAAAPARGRGRKIALVAVLVVLAALAGLVNFSESLLGVDAFSALTEYRGLATDETPPQTDATAPPAEKAPPKQEPPPAPVVELNAANVNRLGYAALREGAAGLAEAMAEDDDATRGLLLWAWYRLASTYGDERAQEKLFAQTPAKLDDPQLDTVAAAAGVGAMLLQQKLGPARRLVERLRRRHKDSPYLAFVAGVAFAGQGNKSVKLFERAAKDDTGFVDARFAAGEALLHGRNAQLGVEKLSALSGSVADPELIVRIVTALVDTGHYDAGGQLVSGLQLPDDPEAISPVRRGRVAWLQSRMAVLRGDLKGAAAAAARRVEIEPQNEKAAIELAHLRTAAGDNGADTLATAFERMAEDGAKAAILAEQIHLAVGKGDLDGARALLASGADLPKRVAGPWLALSEGRIAERDGDAKVARTKYAAAARGRSSFAEARLAQVLLDSGPTGDAMAKLTALAKQSSYVGADYHLALAMADRGNAGGAADLLEEVIWKDPTVTDPIELLLVWLALVNQNGQNARAMGVAESVQRARPDDPRVVKLLVDLAESSGDAALVVKWWRELVNQNPDNFQYKAAFAARLMNADRDAEARTLLDEVQTRKEAKRDPEVLYQLGRAWAERDPIKARGFLIEARAIKPSARVHLLLGSIDERRGKDDTAREAYKSAVELDPDLDEARMGLARLLSDDGELQKAERHLRILAKKNPDDVAVAELLGDTLRDMERPREALRAYQKAVNGVAKPTSDLLMKIAKIQLRGLNQVGPAVKTLERILQADPELGEAQYMIGYVYKDMGRIREAKQALETYLELVSDGDELADDVRSDLANLSRRGR